MAVVINDATFQTSSILSLAFKRNSGFFVNCPIAVSSPCLLLNNFFLFLKEALRDGRSFKILCVCVFFFFKGLCFT